MSKGKLALLLLALAHVTCHQAILTAPPESTITLVANPTFIVANGGVSVISALLIEKAGTPVPDGTVVQFFTNLGRIDEQGKTNDGVARVNLVSDSRSGLASITAVSGPAAVTKDDLVAIGSVLPDLVIVTAEPIRIERTDPRESFIIANVFDERGNPVANVPVIFTIDGTPDTERMVSESSQRFTDNNGRAEDVMRTKYDLNAAPKVVTVRATTANDITATTLVTIN